MWRLTYAQIPCFGGLNIGTKTSRSCVWIMSLILLYGFSRPNKTRFWLWVEKHRWPIVSSRTAKPESLIYLFDSNEHISLGTMFWCSSHIAVWHEASPSAADRRRWCCCCCCPSQHRQTEWVLFAIGEFLAYSDLCIKSASWPARDTSRDASGSELKPRHRMIYAGHRIMSIYTTWAHHRLCT